MFASLVLLWAVAVLAQENPLCDGCNNCTIEGLCGNPYTTLLSVNFAEARSFRNSTLWLIQVQDVPTECQCYSLEALARNRTDLTGPPPGISSVDVIDASYYDANANYSRVTYRQGPSYVGEGVFGDAVLQAYSNLDCLEDQDAMADSVYTWSCAPGVSSRTDISVGVKSFSIRPTAEEDRQALV